MAFACRPCWSVRMHGWGTFDHTLLDHTSILKFIEENWDIPSLATSGCKGEQYLLWRLTFPCLRARRILVSDHAGSTGST